MDLHYQSFPQASTGMCACFQGSCVLLFKICVLAFKSMCACFQVDPIKIKTASLFLRAEYFNVILYRYFNVIRQRPLENSIMQP